jgi:hypothetical protein
MAEYCTDRAHGGCARTPLEARDIARDEARLHVRTTSSSRRGARNVVDRAIDQASPAQRRPRRLPGIALGHATAQRIPRRAVRDWKVRVPGENTTGT